MKTTEAPKKCRTTRLRDCETTGQSERWRLVRPNQTKVIRSNPNQTEPKNTLTGDNGENGNVRDENQENYLRDEAEPVTPSTATFPVRQLSVPSVASCSIRQPSEFLHHFCTAFCTFISPTHCKSTTYDPELHHHASRLPRRNEVQAGTTHHASPDWLSYHYPSNFSQAAQMRIPIKSDTCSNPYRTAIPMDIGQ